MPDVFTPLNVMTVIDALTLCDSVAVAVTPLNVDGANARQISAVPRCTLARWTSCQVNPPPAIPVTVVAAELILSADTNASSSSSPCVVENAGLAIVVALLDRSVDVVRRWRAVPPPP